MRRGFFLNFFFDILQTNAIFLFSNEQVCYNFIPALQLQLFQPESRLINAKAIF